jgi:hypothetical protein
MASTEKTRDKKEIIFAEEKTEGKDFNYILVRDNSERFSFAE